MRPMIMVLAGLVLTTATAASAQQAPVAALAPGEVPLQISASGSVTSPADKITVTIPLSASGETPAVARAVNQVTIDWLKTALVAQGVDAGAITVLPSPADSFGIFTVSDAARALTAGGAKKTAHAVVQVELRDAAQLAHVTALLEGRNQTMSAPAYALRDDSAARATATAEAIRKAQSEAESTAAAMGYRVVRITRVSNYGQSPFDSGDLAAMAQTMFVSRGGNGGQVVTQVRVWIDFAMRPR